VGAGILFLPASAPGYLSASRSNLPYRCAVFRRNWPSVAVVVSYGAVWDFVHEENLSFKNNRAGQRAGSP